MWCHARLAIQELCVLFIQCVPSDSKLWASSPRALQIEFYKAIMHSHWHAHFRKQTAALGTKAAMATDQRGIANNVFEPERQVANGAHWRLPTRHEPVDALPGSRCEQSQTSNQCNDTKICNNNKILQVVGTRVRLDLLAKGVITSQRVWVVENLVANGALE